MLTSDESVRKQRSPTQLHRKGGCGCASIAHTGGGFCTQDQTRAHSKGETHHEAEQGGGSSLNSVEPLVVGAAWLWEPLGSPQIHGPQPQTPGSALGVPSREGITGTGEMHACALKSENNEYAD